MMGHHLPRGKMPCKWHGWDNDCVKRDAIFNPQGPRVCHDINGSIIYLFRGQFRCMTRKALAPPGTPDELDEDENNFYYFVGHCPEVLCYLSPNIRSSLGMAISQKRAFTTTLVESIVNDGAGHMGFERIQKKLAGGQMRLFYKLKRDFYAVRASHEIQSTIYGRIEGQNLELRTRLCSKGGIRIIAATYLSCVYILND